MPGSSWQTPLSRSPRETGSVSSAATARARPPWLRCCQATASPPPAPSGHTGSVGYLPQDPRTGDLDVLALDRILSARGLDEVRNDMRKAEALMSDPDPVKAEKAIRRYGNLSDRLAVLGGYAAESEAASHGREPRAARPGAPPAAAHPLRRPAAAGRARPHPVRRLPGAAARRAHQPPGRRLDRLAPRPPEELPRRPAGDQPRRGPGRAGRQQGLLPGRQPLRARHLQRRLEGLPDPARGRRAAPQAGAGQRREAGRPRCSSRRPSWAPRRPRPRPRRTWRAGPSGCSTAWPTSGRRTGWPSCASPSPRPAARRR